MASDRDAALQRAAMAEHRSADLLAREKVFITERDEFVAYADKLERGYGNVLRSRS